MTAFYKDNKKLEYQLIQLNENKRLRKANSRRVCQFELDISEDYNNQSETYAYLRNYGFTWSSKLKGNKFARPTIIEVIDGLKLLLKSNVEE